MLFAFLILAAVLLIAAAVRHARKCPVRIACTSANRVITVTIEKRAFRSWPKQLPKHGGFYSEGKLYVGRAPIGDDDCLARLISDAHAEIDRATGKSSEAAEMLRLGKRLAGKRA